MAQPAGGTVHLGTRPAGLLKQVESAAAVDLASGGLIWRYKAREEEKSLFNRITGALSTPFRAFEKEEYLPIWGIRESQRATFYVLLITLWTTDLILWANNMVPQGTDPNTMGKFRYAVETLQAFDNAKSALGTDPLNSVAAAMMATTIWSTGMNLMKYFTHRGVAEVVEGHVERGRQEGRQENQALWKAWNERRLEAQEKGEPFDEPPPGKS